MNTTIIILAVISSGLLSTIISLAVGWIKDNQREKKQERKRLFKIKEDAYREVMKNIDFIYEGVELPSREISKKKYSFLENYRIMFLYSEDEIIKGINNVLDVLVSFSPNDDEKMLKKKSKIAHCMIILRKQIVKDTTLTEKDFKHIT